MAYLNIPILILAAVVDSISTCSIGALILILTKTLWQTRSKSIRLTTSSAYILSLFLTRSCFAILMIPIIHYIASINGWIYPVIGAALLLSGASETIEYFWKGKGFKIFPARQESSRLRIYAQKIHGGAASAFWIGMFVGIGEIPYAATIYLSIITLMSIPGIRPENINWIVIYNIIFALPLIALTYQSIKGVPTERFEALRQRNKELVSLITGISTIILSILLIWTSSP